MMETLESVVESEDPVMEFIPERRGEEENGERRERDVGRRKVGEEEGRGEWEGEDIGT